MLHTSAECEAEDSDVQIISTTPGNLGKHPALAETPISPHVKAIHQEEIAPTNPFGVRAAEQDQAVNIIQLMMRANDKNRSSNVVMDPAAAIPATSSVTAAPVTVI